jgi:hypothetical protein
VSNFVGAGIALDWNVELNAARTSIQRVVLFDNSREITIQTCVRRRNGPKLPFSATGSLMP